MIYLDNAATTYPKPEEVYQALDKANRELCVNSGRGSYSLARRASKLIQDTKDMIRQLVNDEKNSAVVFTPSITIALNQIVNGISWERGSTVYVSPYEHNAVARTLQKASIQNGFCVKQLPLKEDSLEIDIEKVKYEFAKERPCAVFCTHISNVTGYVLPVLEVFREAKVYNAITILDSAQSLGLIRIDCRELSADLIAFAGHKTLYGPFGIGGFINIGNIKLEPYFTGGTGSDSLNLNMPNDNESKFEPSSPNIVAVAGLNAALKTESMSKNYQHEKELTDHLITLLQQIDGIKTYIHVPLEKHIGIVSFSVEGFNSNDIGQILDEEFDIAVRTGYHCAPYIHEYMGSKKSLGTVRIGLSQFNTMNDIEMLIDALKEIIE